MASRDALANPSSLDAYVEFATDPPVMTTLDVDSLVAIDMHVHVEQDGHGCLSLDQELLDASAKYFKSTADRTAHRRTARRATPGPVDGGSDLHRRRHHGARPSCAVELRDRRRRGAARDVLIPFGSVDPHQVDQAVERVRRLVGDHGVRGFKFHPTLQAFAPNDERFYPIYAAIEQAGVPVVFHTGQTGIGAGLPGGRGLKLRYSQPMLLDDVAADFPAPDSDPRPPVGALAGRGDLDGDAQGQRVHRSVRVVTRSTFRPSSCVPPGRTCRTR